MHARSAIFFYVLISATWSYAQPDKAASDPDSTGEPSTLPRIPEGIYADGRDDPSFMFCTIVYDGIGSVEPLGFGWSTDWPESGFNLMAAIAENTSIEIARDSNGDPEQTILRLTDTGLKDFPFIFMSDVGTVGFTPEEATSLRDYLLSGGFLHVDDFWGTRAWRIWEHEIGEVLPPEDYPIKDIPSDHEILHVPFEVGEVPQIPNIQFWRSTKGPSRTSERGEESRVPHLRGIWDKEGRLMVVMSYNTDLADGWVTEAKAGTEYYRRFAQGGGFALGMNIVSYALGH